VDNFNPRRWSNFYPARTGPMLHSSIKKRQPVAAVLVRDRDREAQVRFDQLLGVQVTAPDPPGELDIPSATNGCNLAMCPETTAATRR
jgi:hypothetical protein